MSQPLRSDRFTPSPRPNQPAAHISPLNALSNQSPPPYVTGSPPFGLSISQRLIPRDYLTSKSKPEKNVNGLASRHTALTSITKEPSSSGTGPETPSATGSVVKQGSAKIDLRLRRDNVRIPNKESETSEENLNVTRTRSAEASESLNTINGNLKQSRTKPMQPTNAAVQNNMPRTSSLDSALSSVSASSTPNKGTGDSQPPSPNTIRKLIDAAGSAESLIAHLLKEKSHGDAQNSQLWKLVEKQRALLMGLNKDLERMTTDRDRYKKKLNELCGPPATPSKSPQSPTMAETHSKGFPAVQRPAHTPDLQNPDSARLQQGPFSDDGRSVRSPASTEDGRWLGSPGPPVVIPEDPEQHVDGRSQLSKLRTQAADAAQPSFIFTEATPLSEKLRTQTPDLAQPHFIFTDASPLSEKPNKIAPSSRKAPPKPLILSQRKGDAANQQPAIHSEESLVTEERAEEPVRGRRKTREEDDRDREDAAIKEQEARSRSKKEIQLKPVTSEELRELGAIPGPTLPASPRPQIQGFAPPANLAALAGNTTGPIPQSAGIDRLGAPLRSPGLPASPRPIHQNFAGLNSLPLSPRAPTAAFPLSPRAPKQPLPQLATPTPFTDPAIIQKQNNLARQAQMQSQTPTQPPPYSYPQSQPQGDRLQVYEPPTTRDTPPVYHGLRDPAYPNLLLPPNALPSIQVRVASSRLRPPRQGAIGMKYEEQSGVFSLSIFSRASRNELWRIEKHPNTLGQLEQQLRPRCAELPRLPDRKLFTGQAPAIMDLRRKAVDEYWEELLDMQIDEQSAVMICRYLSSDLLDPEEEAHRFPGINQDSLPQSTSLSGRVVKTGFLTKRGKNFGGWKSRYFVLDSPELRYYETPGGPQIGTIKVSQARIGSQKQDETSSADTDGTYRHAFLIQEPKKKDLTSFVRHVLCAESDAERDEWVTALLHYVEDSGDMDGRDSRASTSTTATTGKLGNSFPLSVSSGPLARDRALKADDLHGKSPSPTSINSMGDITSGDAGNSRSANISAPINGAPIANSAQWGNKIAPLQGSKDKNNKKGTRFHFRKASQEMEQPLPPPKPRILRHNGYVRPVFGLPLSEAVEFCAPFNIDIDLPAVVYRTIEYLQYRNAANEEGLFRIGGSNVTIKTLKERFDTEGDVDLVAEGDDHDVHAVASLFKTYLRELPSSILTRDLHLEFLRVLELSTKEQKVEAFNVLVHRLPAVNFNVLRALSQYLIEVTNNSDKNKMSIKNVGIVFSPTLNIPTPVFTLFLTEFDSIFDQQPLDSEDSSVHTVEHNPPAKPLPQDIRSPRHQMFTDLPTPAYNQPRFPDPSVPDATTPRILTHDHSASAEFGMIPIHPSYDNTGYVSKPQAVRHPRIPDPQAQPEEDYEQEGYGSLNRMMVPDDDRSAKAKRRESALVMY